MYTTKAIYLEDFTSKERDLDQLQIPIDRLVECIPLEFLIPFEKQKTAFYKDFSEWSNVYHKSNLLGRFHF
jgi:hypothetical protein